MNARVFLLVLVTGAFMAIWDADRPAASQASANHAKAHHEAPPVSDGLIPLPSDLKSGAWLAFNHGGDTFRITIENRTRKPTSASANQLTQTDAAKQFRVLTGGDGVRWCFVMEEPRTVRRDETEQR